MLKLLLYIFERFRVYFLLALYLFISIFFISINNNSQISALQKTSLEISSYLIELISIFPNPYKLQEEKNLLQEKNLNINLEINSLRDAKLENEHLRKLLEFKNICSLKTISAEIVGKTTHLPMNTITINIGEKNKIKKNMPIISEDGLVGKIIFTSENYSIGNILLHKDSRVSATIERNGINGIVSWEGGENLILKNIVKSIDIKIGDRVLTSIYSNIFPKNIEIGIVSKTSETPEDIFKKIWISPSVNFYRLDKVFIVTTEIDSEKVAIEKNVFQK